MGNSLWNIPYTDYLVKGFLCFNICESHIKIITTIINIVICWKRNIYSIHVYKYIIIYIKKKYIYYIIIMRIRLLNRLNLWNSLKTEIIL